MSEIATIERASAEPERKPVVTNDDVKFPPFPDPTDDDFDEDVTEEEKTHYKNKFLDLNKIVTVRLHCTACDRHLGCSADNDSLMRLHPMLRTLICNDCHKFYNSGEFDKGEDGSELYCRWCGQGGQVYCCSDCVHVFCAKCIKRNLGLPKIREIENTDDWKCFKCNPKCLWDLRAVCWALLRYCDLRNRLVSETEDSDLKQQYAKAIAIDLTECCKNKARRGLKADSAKKREKEVENIAKKIISKMPPTIQVKKFASVNLDEFKPKPEKKAHLDEYKPKPEKKAQKRPVSPKNKAIMIKNPIAITPCTMGPSINKKFRMTSPSLYSPMRYPAEKKVLNLTRIQRPRILGNNFNGYNSPGAFNPMNMNNMNNMNLNNMNNMNLNNMNNMNLVNDNINLSLDSLTQGLDFAAVQAMNNSNPTFANNDNVVCTPDFPLEPLCEVTEDNDDDVECITPAPVAAPKVSNPPPLAPVRATPLTGMPKGNVIQMTDSDVTVNALTGGLKFRVDPQTLSSNKMYRLPDGRIFAINANPNMPGGYSATIVSQNPDGSPKVTPRSETFAAKLSAVSHASSPKAKRGGRNAGPQRRKTTLKNKPAKPKEPKAPKDASRETDLKVPVEWYRYNMIDAVDALEYSLSRLHKLKKEATSTHLRTRTIDEMKYLHRTLEQLLTTSSKRFIEIRDTLNKEMKMYLTSKESGENSSEEDDDDVEILPNTELDDPIFIDENSVDSVNGTGSQEVDLTGVGSSEHNDSAENRNDADPLNVVEQEHENINNLYDDSTSSANVLIDFGTLGAETSKDNSNGDAEKAKEQLLVNHDETDKMDTDEPAETSNNSNEESSDPKAIELNGDDDKTDNEETTKPSDKEDEDITDDKRNYEDEIVEKENNESDDKTDEKQNNEDEIVEKERIESDDKTDEKQNNEDEIEKENSESDDKTDEKQNNEDEIVENEGDDKQNTEEDDEVNSSEKELSDKKADQEIDKEQDGEMSEEMIETLLKDDNLDENASMEISDLQEAEQILS